MQTTETGAGVAERPAAVPRPSAAEELLGVLSNLVLVIMVILPPAWAMAAVKLDPVLPFGMLVWVSLVAIAVGVLFAYAGLPGEIAHPVATFGGIGGVFYVIAQVMPNVPPEAGLTDRLLEIVREVTTWFQTISGGGQATNNLLFLLLLALIAWIIGYFGAWAVFRERSAWWPITVSATALTLTLATFPNLYGYMVIQLVAAMLLIGRINLESRQQVWDANGLRRAAGDFGWRGFRTSLLLALALVLLTWAVPNAMSAPALTQRLGQEQQPWQQAQADFNRLFGGLQPQNNQASLSGFSRSMTLHGSFHLADTPVLAVASAQPEYWRAVVFDQYTGHGWVSSDPVDQQTLSAGSDILRPNDLDRTNLVQQFTVLAPRGNYLVGAEAPISFDRTVSAQAFPNAPSGQVDLIDAFSLDPVVRGTHYSVVSSVSDASTVALRTANQAYPNEVRQRYLTLPPIPDRVRQLAQQLTASQPDPYDKAVAVESYLRTMPYSLNVPAPPANQDAVDYFLFDTRTGYCDYFASAMAVMLRSVGVPARVVSGYATGTQQNDGTYLVKDSDSHSWTEVYLPPYGWIPFEPSGGFPRFARGQDGPAGLTPTPVSAVPTPVGGATSQGQATPTPAPTPTPTAGSSTPPPAKQPVIPPAVLQSLLPLLGWLAVLVAVAALLWYLWEKDLRGLPPTVVAYVKMTRLAGLLGFGPRTGETPDEYGQALAGALPEAGTSVSRITDDYARYRFGRQLPDRTGRPLRLWRFVRNALLRRVGRLRRE
jgi:transglutaminase-like putative cysteine protease